MDLQSLRDIVRHAEYYHIRHKYERTGDFDYAILFTDTQTFTDAKKAVKFIDNLVETQHLTRYTKPYRVGFGWEIY